VKLLHIQRRLRSAHDRIVDQSALARFASVDAGGRRFRRSLQFDPNAALISRAR
jgi:hypothetical protein